MNCSNCGKELTEIGHLAEGEIVAVKRVCTSCGIINETRFMPPVDSKIGHVATIKYGSEIVRTPIIGEWRDRFDRRYFYVAIWEESEKRFLSYAENSFSLQSISTYPMQMGERTKAMARAIYYLKRANRCQKVVNRYLPYEEANKTVVVIFNIAGQASFRDEFEYEFNEGDVRKRATAIRRRDYYMALYKQSSAEAGLFNQ